jgi:hypothetical protein
MPIRTAETFEVQATRDIMHHKSAELKDVIKKLRFYHGDEKVDAALRGHRLLELSDSVKEWKKTNPIEFSKRHGPELQKEVDEEVRSSTQTKAAEFEPLVDGDILFRWVPRNIGQRDFLQGLIGAAQYLQDQRHRHANLDEINIGHSVLLIEHVGIFHNDSVSEIGRVGLTKEPVASRNHYDLVVRSRTHGGSIARVASSARSAKKWWGSKSLRYPFWDLATVSLLPHAGARLLQGRGNSMLLKMDDREHRKKGDANQMGQLPICSHFVNAVLYAAIRPGGTIATATDHSFDDIFKVGPAQMWREFMHRQGLWGETDAKYIGLQHKGNVDRTIEPQKLGVGLPPQVPSKANRPPRPRH